MILPDFKIRELCKRAESPLVTPYDPANVNPASIDLRLSGQFVDMHTGEKFDASSLTLRPGDAVLASTLEYVRLPESCAGLLALKSSSARKGLDHALAGWVDPGFWGDLTLELHAHREVTFEHGQRVIQLILMQMAEVPEKSYCLTGRYFDQRGPTEIRPEKQ